MKDKFLCKLVFLDICITKLGGIGDQEVLFFLGFWKDLRGQNVIFPKMINFFVDDEFTA